MPLAVVRMRNLLSPRIAMPRPANAVDANRRGQCSAGQDQAGFDGIEATRIEPARSGHRSQDAVNHEHEGAACYQLS